MLADSPGELERKALGALSRLYRHDTFAAENANRAYAILVFPEARKIAAGFGIETATGVLFTEGKSLSFYNLTGLSCGFEIGIRKFAFAIFFNDESAFQRFKDATGFMLGCSHNLVIADDIVSRNSSTTTRQPGVQGFVFNQSGFMLDLGIHISKITEYEPGE